MQLPLLEPEVTSSKMADGSGSCTCTLMGHQKASLYYLYCPPSFEKHKMKNYIHKCSRVSLWHTVTTYNEILKYWCQRIDHEELSLDDVICLVTQFTSCIAEPSEYFPQRFSIEWPRTWTMVQGLLTVLCAHDCLSISVKWRLYFLISEIWFSDTGKWPNCPILVNQHDKSRYR